MLPNFNQVNSVVRSRHAATQSSSAFLLLKEFPLLMGRGMPRPYSPAPHSLTQPIQGYYIINLLHEPLRNLEKEEKTDLTKEESQPITNWTVQKKPLHRKKHLSIPSDKAIHW
ncbi:hypothetical protein EVA_16868 [gut metagenome]|uniref:Uncharacterized protein n=1 Tax=gut metagenome TaxID=749906 RepID=J9G6E4_9ZZZZ